MFYLAELYSPKSAWRALPQEDRALFFMRIQSGMAGLADAGIEIIAMGRTDNSKLYPASQQFFALWKFPAESALDALLEGIKATGWHEYFDTVNAAGKGENITEHLKELAALE